MLRWESVGGAWQESVFENPLIYLSDRFETRRDLTSVGAVEEVGMVELGDFFSGSRWFVWGSIVQV